MGLDFRWLAEASLTVRSPPAMFAVVLGILDSLTHPVKFLPDHDLAQVVLLVAVTAAFTLVYVLAHGCLLVTRSSHGDGKS
jgi:type III secretory pathway component EscS